MPVPYLRRGLALNPLNEQVLKEVIHIPFTLLEFAQPHYVALPEESFSTSWRLANE